MRSAALVEQPEQRLVFPCAGPRGTTRGHRRAERFHLKGPVRAVTSGTYFSDGDGYLGSHSARIHFRVQGSDAGHRLRLDRPLASVTANGASEDGGTTFPESPEQCDHVTLNGSTFINGIPYTATPNGFTLIQTFSYAPGAAYVYVWTKQ